ncbi:hypothetical protein [Azospirillum picis]|uniref:Uncharacterized protein n=1 Tax=Azospirillum picis TaxID=488438 RepID=A0ABU0MSI2_9PROT|nr:hypothetical protein [Azospirillum picis]MBP2302699.1 hypothetical protein [Azospirillum picis]MDQ0536450.1 hypothetical protein [Azospirillum picis]
MTRLHIFAIVLAILCAIALLVGMLFGHQVTLERQLGLPRSLRDISVALWAFLLPAWFMLEDVWFAPDGSDPAKIRRFRDAQQKARLTWVVVGGAVGIVIGLTAPNLPAMEQQNAPTQSQNNGQ